MESLTEVDCVKVTDFQVSLCLEFCHSNHVSVTWVKTGAKPTITTNKQMSTSYLSVPSLKLIVCASV